MYNALQYIVGIIELIYMYITYSGCQKVIFIFGQ